MDMFYSAKATIDNQFFLVKSDDSFIKYLKADIYVYLLDCIHPEDKEKFMVAVNRLKDRKMQENYVMARVLRHDGQYFWMMIGITREKADLHGRDLVNLVFTSPDAIKENLAKTVYKNNEYEVYLGLSEGIFLTYDVDHNLVEVYMMDKAHRRYLFLGAIEAWEKEYMMGRVDDNYEAAWERVLANLKAGRDTDEVLLTNAFEDSDNMELYRIRFMAVKHSEDNKKMVGCVIPMDKKHSLASNDVSNKDIDLDVYNKQYIIEFAKKKISLKKKFYLGIIDMDNFKFISESKGIMFADGVVAKAAEIIKEAIEGKGYVGRIASDAFMVIIDDVDEHSELRNIFRNIRTNIEWYYKQKEADLMMTCSIGVATYPTHADTFDKVFEIADKMLRIAKEKGRNRYVIYSPDIHGLVLGDEAVKKESGVKGWAPQIERPAIIQKLVSDYLLNKGYTNIDVLKLVGENFGLDEVLVVREDIDYRLRWVKDVGKVVVKAGESLTFDEIFDQRFDSANLFIMNGLYNAERDNEGFINKMTDANIEAAVFYRVVIKGKYSGYVMFAKKNGRYMWTESEIMAFATAGQVLALGIDKAGLAL